MGVGVGSEASGGSPGRESSRDRPGKGPYSLEVDYELANPSGHKNNLLEPPSTGYGRAPTGGTVWQVIQALQ